MCGVGHPRTAREWTRRLAASTLLTVVISRQPSVRRLRYHFKVLSLYRSLRPGLPFAPFASLVFNLPLRADSWTFVVNRLRLR